MARRAAAASEGVVAEAAREALARGNAVDAVVAGLLVAAAQSPGVLLGPAQILVAGGGAGLVAVDGRTRQPGLGIPRPRGVLGDAPVPPAANVAVPGLPAALATVVAAQGTSDLRRLASAAVSLARAVSPERAAALEAFGRRGVPGLTDDLIYGELAAAAGRTAGGALTREDIRSFVPPVLHADEGALEPAGWLRAPWTEPGLDSTRVRVVAAADARGRLCIACYEIADEGVPVPALGLVAPALAAVVRRGLPRVRPGEPRPAAAPIALRSRRGVCDLAVGLSGCPGGDAVLEQLLGPLDDAARVAEILGATPGRPVALVWTDAAATVVASG